MTTRRMVCGLVPLLMILSAGCSGSDSSTAATTTVAPGSITASEQPNSIAFLSSPVGRQLDYRIPTNQANGDSWSITSDSSPGVLQLDSTEHVGSGGPGAGEHTSFKFTAKKAGTTTIVFSNCVRCQPGAKAPDGADTRRIEVTIK